MIKCIAIDDEPLALTVISQFCNRYGNIILKCFSDPGEALKLMENNLPDLVFLDIEMNEYNGLQIAKNVKDKTIIIFTTAYPEYALEGFNLDAVDFLHKPFSYDRFCEAMEKAERRLNYNILDDKGIKQIVVKQEYHNIPILLSEILYIEAMGNYSKIYLVDGKMIIAHNSLKSIGLMLPSSDFIRIHKSFIINRKGINSYNQKAVHLTDGKVISVGRRYSKNLAEI